LFLVVILNEVKNLDFAFSGLTALGNIPERPATLGWGLVFSYCPHDKEE
jgi:hypothetical protein